MRISMTIAVLSIACGGAPAATSSSVRIERPPRAEPPRLLSDEEAAQTHTQAMTVHVQAQELLANCGEDEGLCRQALSYFEIAADTWRALIDGRPDDASPEWSFMLAQALVQLDRFEPAAEAAERYLELGAPEWRLEAARLSVRARERAARGAPLPEAAPEPAGDPPAPRAIEMPASTRALAVARVRFAQIATEAGDPEHEARAATLGAARAYYLHGEWERATELSRPLFEAGCAGENAWDGAASSWRMLRDMAWALGRHDSVRALGDEVAARSCTFGGGAPSCGPSSDDPRCIARADRVAWLLRGGTQWIERARQARAADRSPFFVRAGEAFLAALDTGELDPRGRVTALDAAASAFREGGSEQAAAVDARIVRDVDPRRFEETDRPLAIASVASALSRQLEAALTASEHASVVSIARRLLTPAFDLPELADERDRARALLPPALVAMNRGAEASRAYADLAAATDDPLTRRDAELRAGMVASCAQATRALRTFVTTYGARDDAANSVVRALWRLAECQRRSAPSLEELAAAGEAARNLDTEAAGYAAHARFSIADRDFAALTRFRIRVPGGEDVEEMVANLQAELEEPTEQLGELLDGYARVERINSPRWSAAARQRSGAALEALERAVLDASWELPGNIEEQRRLLNPAGFALVRRNVELRAAEILRNQGEAIRCRAIVHYQRAISIAAAGSVESPEVTLARERLAAIRPPDRCPR